MALWIVSVLIDILFACENSCAESSKYTETLATTLFGEVYFKKIPAAWLASVGERGTAVKLTGQCSWRPENQLIGDSSIKGFHWSGWWIFVGLFPVF